MTFLRIVIITSLAIYNLCHADVYARDNTILVLGDSLSAAYGIDIELGWVNLLRNRLDIMQHDIEDMVKRCSVTGTSILLGIKLPPNYGEKYTQAFHQIYIDIAKECDIPLVPFLLNGIALKDEYLQADRLHPTAEAQPIILENVWPTLEKWLESI